MSRRATQYGSLGSVLLLVIVTVISAFPGARAAVHSGSPTGYLISPPDPIIAERSEQTYRGWRSVPTPVPTPLATPVPPPKATPEPPRKTPRPILLIWPVHGPITTYYQPSHRAIDIAAPKGTPVKAACSGKVIYASWKNDGGGNVVDIACSNGLTVSNNHMSAIEVAVGQAITLRGVVGKVGMTGNATGPHLHFAVFRHGVAVNPFIYLP